MPLSEFEKMGEEQVKDECHQCVWWQQRWQAMGSCEDIFSEHYKHLILSSHPACDKIIKKD